MPARLWRLQSRGAHGPLTCFFNLRTTCQANSFDAGRRTCGQIHKPGYIIQTMSDLRDIVPSHMFVNAFKREDFEKKIFAYYVNHRGKSDMIVRLLYLQYVRQVRPPLPERPVQLVAAPLTAFLRVGTGAVSLPQWPFYGATFFDARMLTGQIQVRSTAGTAAASEQALTRPMRCHRPSRGPSGRRSWTSSKPRASRCASASTWRASTSSTLRSGSVSVLDRLRDAARQRSF